MWVQKTFHLPVAQEAAWDKLADLRAYRYGLPGVEAAAMTGAGQAYLRFRLPWGFRGCMELAEVPAENPRQRIFRTAAGNVEAVGLVEFFPVRADLTAVVLTLHYSIGSLWFRLMDRMAGSVDRFLNEQLTFLEAYFARPIRGVRANRALPRPINGHSTGQTPPAEPEVG